MSDPTDLSAGAAGADLVGSATAPSNDNLDRFDSLTKQGLLLQKAFYSIEDPVVRYEVLCHVQSLAEKMKTSLGSVEEPI